MEEGLLKQGAQGSQSLRGSWECLYGRALHLQLRVSAQGNIELDAGESGQVSPWYCIPCRSTPPSVLRGFDVIGAITSDAALTIWYTVAPASGAAQAKRTLRRLALRLSGPQEAEEAAAAIRCTACSEAPRRLLVVINPVSGRGKGKTLFQSSILPLLEAAGIRAQVVVTRQQGHAISVVRAHGPHDIDAIAVVGGDGTVFEVLQGLLARPDWEAARQLPLAQIPAGSGNGLAASTGLWSVPTAVHALIKGSTRPIDVASVLQPPGSRVFSFLSLTYGMIPNLDIGTNHLRRGSLCRWLGSSRFVLGALHQILKQGTYGARVSFVDVRHADGAVGAAAQLPTAASAVADPEEGGPPLFHIGQFKTLQPGVGSISDLHLPAPWQPLFTGEVQFFAACNIPWLDTNFHVAPKTRLDDGHLTLLYSLGKLGRIKGLQFMLSMDTGQHLEKLHCKHPIAFILEPGASKTWVVVDGEEMPHRLAFVEVHPSLCRVFVCPQDPGEPSAAQRTPSNQGLVYNSRKPHHQN